MTNSSSWYKIRNPDSGIPFVLSEALENLESRVKKDLLHDVRNGTMLIVSDYSGQHKQATCEAYSFLLTTMEAVEEWLPSRQNFRQNWLQDGRRMSFKKLNEAVRFRALIPFLKTAGMIKGNLITILVDQRVESFMEGGARAASAVFEDIIPPNTKLNTLEKILRISTLMSFLLAAFRDENQKSIWVSDNDETIEPFDRGDALGAISSILTWGLTRWENPADASFLRIGVPGVPSWFEDLASIPDLVAGAYCSLSDVLPRYLGRTTWQTTVGAETERDDRARIVGNWSMGEQGRLRHLLIRLELDKSQNLKATAQTCFAKAV